MLASDDIPTVLAGSIVLVLGLAYFIIQSDGPHEFLTSQPWVGLQGGWLPRLRASLRTIKDMRGMVYEGYERFARQKTAFVLPVIGEAPWLVLPPASLPEMISKSATNLDPSIIHEYELQTCHTQGALGHHAATVPLQFDIVRRQLTRQLPLVTSAMQNEVHRSFKDYWGTDITTETEINLLDTCTKIVTRAANRVFIGSDACRNEAFIQHLQRYTEAVGWAGIIIRLLPSWLRPLLAPVVRAWYRRDLAICRGICVPIVRRRVQETLEKRKDWEAPVDALQWIVEAALQDSNPTELDPLLLTQRLLMLNFVSMQTTAMATTHAIADLYSSPEADRFVAGLREECDRVLGSKWTKAQLDQLVRVDSAIRESMRVSDFASIAMPRLVVNPEGVDFASTSSPLHIPPGVRVCVPSHSIHHDAAFYPDPSTYNALRFADLPARAAVATTADSFLVFGHGRYACPGRFFAAQVMKIVVAYLVQHYEVAKPAHPVEKQVQVGTVRPDANLRLIVRRRSF